MLSSNSLTLISRSESLRLVRSLPVTSDCKVHFSISLFNGSLEVDKFYNKHRQTKKWINKELAIIEKVRLPLPSFSTKNDWHSVPGVPKNPAEYQRPMKYLLATVPSFRVNLAENGIHKELAANSALCYISLLRRNNWQLSWNAEESDWFSIPSHRRPSDSFPSILKLHQHRWWTTWHIYSMADWHSKARLIHPGEISALLRQSLSISIEGQ